MRNNQQINVSACNLFERKEEQALYEINCAIKVRTSHTGLIVLNKIEIELHIVSAEI